MSWFDDIGSGIGNIATGIGNGLSDAYSSVFGSGQPQGPTNQSQVVPNGPSGGTALPTGAAVSAPSTPSFLSQAWDTISGGNGVGGLVKNISPLISGGAGLASVLKGSGSNNVTNQLQANATSAQQAAAPLLAATAGALPQGEEQDVQNTLAASIAQIKAKYAQMGLSGSTMEQQDIANANNQASAQRATMAQQAVTTGANVLGVSNQGFTNVAASQAADDKSFQEALTALASAFGGAGGTKTPAATKQNNTSTDKTTDSSQ